MPWLMLALIAAAPAQPGTGARDVPTALRQRLPAGYEVLGAAALAFGSPRRRFRVIALGRRGQGAARHGQEAPARPLLIVEQRRDGSFVPVARNDVVVLRADEGGQCDPFLDGGGVIATRGRFFTVENGVACGGHWTDFVTFRFDQRAGRFVFDNERTQSWSLNASDSPDAPALVRDGPPRVDRAGAGRVTFERWRRRR